MVTQVDRGNSRGSPELPIALLRVSLPALDVAMTERDLIYCMTLLLARKQAEAAEESLIEALQTETVEKMLEKTGFEAAKRCRSGGNWTEYNVIREAECVWRFRTYHPFYKLSSEVYRRDLLNLIRAKGGLEIARRIHGMLK